MAMFPLQRKLSGFRDPGTVPWPGLRPVLAVSCGGISGIYTLRFWGSGFIGFRVLGFRLRGLGLRFFGSDSGSTSFCRGKGCRV